MVCSDLGGLKREASSYSPPPLQLDPVLSPQSVAEQLFSLCLGNQCDFSLLRSKLSNDCVYPGRD
ncbi:hypothetical protein PAMP_012498 [Pampus punctatissimus]